LREQGAGAAAVGEAAEPAEQCCEQTHQVGREGEGEGEVEGEGEREFEVGVERAVATGTSSANKAPKCTVPSGAM